MRNDKKAPDEAHEMRPEYDFSGGVRGKHVRAYRQGHTVTIAKQEDSAMNKAIKTKVTEQGVLIPRTLLEGVDEVEIRRENGIITVMPVAQADPISRLGEHPVECGAPDASEQHDKYLYGASP